MTYMYAYCWNMDLYCLYKIHMFKGNTPSRAFIVIYQSMKNKPFANLNLFSNRITSLSYLRHSSFKHNTISFLLFTFAAVIQTFSVFNHEILRNKVLWNLSVLYPVKKSLTSASKNSQFDNLDEIKHRSCPTKTNYNFVCTKNS